MSDAQLATRPRASQQLAAFIGMEPNAMLDTIKAQCFRGNPANISNEQLAAFVSIAAEMGVNPLLPGMLYAYPVSGGGVVPIMGPDGVYKKLMEHPEVDSWETEVFPADVSLPPTHAVTKIYRKGRERPLQYTALLNEWKVGSNPNWNTRSRHMLSLRSLKQCARQIIHGIPGDEDDRVISGEINVTPTVAEAPKVERPAPPKRAAKGAATVVEAEVVSPLPPTPATPPAPPAESKETPVREVAKPTESKPLTQQVDKVLDDANKVAALKAEGAREAEAQRRAKADELSAKLAKEAAANLKTESAQAAVAAEPEGVKPRAFLERDEDATAVVEVVSARGLNITMDNVAKPSIEAKVKGDFNNSVYVYGVESLVATDGPQGKVWSGIPPQWATGTKLRLKLHGKHFPVSGKVYAIVQSAEQVTGSVEAEIS